MREPTRHSERHVTCHLQHLARLWVGHVEEDARQDEVVQAVGEFAFDVDVAVIRLAAVLFVLVHLAVVSDFGEYDLSPIRPQVHRGDPVQQVRSLV